MQEIIYDVYKNGELVEEYCNTQKINNTYGKLKESMCETEDGYQIKRRELNDNETKCLIRLMIMHRHTKKRVFTLKTFIDWDCLNRKYGKGVNT